MLQTNTADLIRAAAGQIPGDLLVRNCRALNVFTGCFEEAALLVKDGRIADPYAFDAEAAEVIDAGGRAVVPSFIDGHIHLESAVISPYEFARFVAAHGTAAAVVDPHEIANVLGTDGIDYILAATEGLPVDIFVMMPSCVPATYVDEAGAVLDHSHVSEYLKHDRVLGLAEMMNYPGVLSADPEVLAKLQAAKESGRMIDGHAPALGGSALSAYVAAGVTSDHECTSRKEAYEKLRRGQWIMIREGSASRNLKGLAPLLNDERTASRCLFVCDDRHPGDLVGDGHIDAVIRRAVALGVKPETAYTAASFNAARRFSLDGFGALAPGYTADFVVLDDVETVSIAAVYRRGVKLTEQSLADWAKPPIPAALNAKVRSTVRLAPFTEADLALRRTPEHVIGLVPWQIITTDDGMADGPDPAKDIVKLAVIERHHATGHIGTALLAGYGLKRGAIATTVAHDSHNIICAGLSDSDMVCAVRRLEELGGGMVAASDGKILCELALPIAGLMTDLDAQSTAGRIRQLHEAAHGLGVHRDIDPFMTLSFVSLPVIPYLRLTTLGVFDVNAFRLI